MNKSSERGKNFYSKQKLHGREKWEKILKNLIVSTSWWAWTLTKGVCDMQFLEIFLNMIVCFRKMTLSALWIQVDQTKGEMM